MFTSGMYQDPSGLGGAGANVVSFDPWPILDNGYPWMTTTIPQGVTAKVVTLPYTPAGKVVVYGKLIVERDEA